MNKRSDEEQLARELCVPDHDEEGKEKRTAKMNIGLAGPNQFESIAEEDEAEEKDWCF